MLGWWDISLYSNPDFWNNANCCYIYRQGQANDIIFSPQHSPAIQTLKKYAQQNYMVREYSDPSSSVGFSKYFESLSCVQAYAYSTSSYVRDSTLKRTGPLLLNTLYTAVEFEQEVTKRIINIDKLPRNVGWIMWAIENTVGKILRWEPAAGTQESQIRVPLEVSAKSWLNLKPKEIDDPELVMQIIMETIDFEIKHFEILRLEDHLNDLAYIFRFEPEKQKFCNRRLMEILSSIELHPQIIVQYPFMVEEEFARGLVKHQGWLANTCLYPVISDLHNTNRAIINVLKYFEKVIQEDAEEVYIIDNGKDPNPLSHDFNCSLEKYLHFINYILAVIDLSEEATVKLELLQEAVSTLSCIEEHSKNLNLRSSSNTPEIRSQLKTKLQEKIVSINASSQQGSSFSPVFDAKMQATAPLVTMASGNPAPVVSDDQKPRKYGEFTAPSGNS